jgi:hypothetical protein
VSRFYKLGKEGNKNAKYVSQVQLGRKERRRKGKRK